MSTMTEKIKAFKNENRIECGNKNCNNLLAIKNGSTLEILCCKNNKKGVKCGIINVIDIEEIFEELFK